MKFCGLFFQQNRWIHSGLASLTSKEVATALRPFIFSIHPDRFWKYPKEKSVNEASLKRLNNFLESNRNRNSCKNETVTFYMRNQDKHLKLVEITLNSSENVNSNVHKILSQCSLSTDYLSKIGKHPRKVSLLHSSRIFQNDNKTFGNFTKRRNNEFFYGDVWDEFEFENEYEQKEEYESEKHPKTVKLVEWIKKNCDTAREKEHENRPIHEDLNRLKDELVTKLGLKDLIWVCDWGVTHIRGCLKNLSVLVSQYPNDMKRLENKVLMFGRQSGVACKGEIILNIEDVRNNWLDMIRSVNNKNPYVSGLQSAEAVLSGLLNEIQIVRPNAKVQLAKHYFNQIDRFSRTLREYSQNNEPPKEWPASLSNFRLTVDSDAGPMMLTNEGTFNIPASCPAKLTFRHIIDNLEPAKILIDNEQTNRFRCDEIVFECINQFSLQSLHSDENITPEQMAYFCSRLLKHRSNIGSSLVDANLRVSMYYNINYDGQLCVPFNFT